jgi:ketosteroid isomerase-like protein
MSLREVRRMSAPPDIEIARQAYTAFTRGDIEGVLQYLSPEIQWRMGARFSRTGRVFEGHEGVREVFALFAEALGDFSVTPIDLYEAPQGVLAPVRIAGHTGGTGAPAVYELVQVWTVRDGLAVRLDVYETLDEACTAIGMTPPAASSSWITAPETGLESR